jgi:prohibitin 2
MGFILFLLWFLPLITAVGLFGKDLLTNRDPKFSPFSAFKRQIPLLVAFVLLLTLSASYAQVDAGNVGIVTRFGNVSRLFSPGAHLVLPFAETVHSMTTQTLVTKPNEDAASHDLQMVKTEVTLAYHFDPAYLGYIYEHVADASDNSVERKVVTPAILEAIKSVTAHYDAQQLVSERPAVRDGIETFVAQRLLQYHIIAETVSITSFHFSEDYEKAIEAKVTAQQNAEKAANDLTRIQVEAQQQIAQAKGEAEALRAQKEQITPELLQLRMIEMMSKKWDGKLPESYFGGQAPLPIVEAFRKQGKQ